VPRANVVLEPDYKNIRLLFVLGDVAVLGLVFVCSFDYAFAKADRRVHRAGSLWKKGFLSLLWVFALVGC
jgi:hypothetical protein